MTPIELWRPEAFQLEAQRWAAYYGMFYGILLVMVLYMSTLFEYAAEATGQIGSALPFLDNQWRAP